MTRKPFASFIVTHTPRVGLDIVVACAKTGDRHWRGLFEHGLANAISQDSKLLREFGDVVIGGKCYSQTAAIVGAFLKGLTAAACKQFLELTPGNAKSHPVGKVFQLAAETGATDRCSIAVLDVLLKNGLEPKYVEVVAKTKKASLERACRACNTPFLELIIPLIGTLPLQMLRRLVEDETGERVVSTLVRCGMSPAIFVDPKVYVYAHRKVQEIAGSMHGRAHRIESRLEPCRTIAVSESRIHNRYDSSFFI